MFFIIIIYINLLLTRQFEKQYSAYTETFYEFKYYKMKMKWRIIFVLCPETNKTAVCFRIVWI